MEFTFKVKLYVEDLPNLKLAQYKPQMITISLTHSPFVKIQGFKRYIQNYIYILTYLTHIYRRQSNVKMERQYLKIMCTVLKFHFASQGKK